MKLLINIIFLIFLLSSCTLDKTKLVIDNIESDVDSNKQEVKILIEKKQNKIEKKTKYNYSY